MLCQVHYIYIILIEFHNFLSLAKLKLKENDFYLHVSLGESPHVLWPGGAGHDSLSVRSDVQQRLPDLGLEPHVQHPVRQLFKMRHFWFSFSRVIMRLGYSVSIKKLDKKFESS